MWGNDKTKENKGVYLFYRNIIQESTAKQFTLYFTISIEIRRKIGKLQHPHSSYTFQKQKHNIYKSNKQETTKKQLSIC